MNEKLYRLSGSVSDRQSRIWTGKAIVDGKWVVSFVMPSSFSLDKLPSPNNKEIKIIENEAYDYGYYEGRTKRANGQESSWKGKYVVVWRKEEDTWKMYLDIWNAVK